MGINGGFSPGQWLAELSPLADGLLDEGVSEEESVEEDEAEPSERVEAESEGCEGSHDGKQNKHQQKSKLGVWYNIQLPSIIFFLHRKKFGFKNLVDRVLTCLQFVIQ